MTHIQSNRRNPNDRPSIRTKRIRLFISLIAVLGIWEIAISSTGPGRVFAQCVVYDDQEIHGMDASPDHGFATAATLSYSDIVIGSPDADGGRGWVDVYRLNELNEVIHHSRVAPENGSSDGRFGHSVIYLFPGIAAAGFNGLLIGAPFDDEAGLDSGAAYLYDIDSDGCAYLVQKLTLPDVTGNEHFGWGLPRVQGQPYSLAIGAPGANGGRGSVGLFQVDNATHGLVYTGELENPDGQPNSYFGWSVAEFEDRVIVGSPFDVADTGVAGGAAWVFRLNDGGGGTTIPVYELESVLRVQGGDFDRFGHSIGVTESSVVIGAPGFDGNGSDSGAAFRFGIGDWDSHQVLIPLDVGEDDRFGSAIAASGFADEGDCVLIGSPGHGESRGAAYVYVSEGNGSLNESVKLMDEPAAVDDQFGLALALSPVGAIVGNPGSDEAITNAGSATFFRRDEGTLDAAHKFVQVIFSPYETYGHSMSIDGQHLVISVPGLCCISDCGCNRGAVIAYEVSSGTVTSSQLLTESTNCDGDGFGDSIQVKGDLLVVGARYAKVDGLPDSDSGAVFVYERVNARWQKTAVLVDLATEDSIEFGKLVATDGNKIAVVVGNLSVSQSTGSAILIFGRSEGGWQREATILGSGLATISDFDSIAIKGDHFVHGAPYTTQFGTLFAYHFSDGAWTLTQQLSPPHASVGDKFGASIDIEGDRLYVGAPMHGRPPTFGPSNGWPHFYVITGAVFEYTFSLDQWNLHREITASDAYPQRQFGRFVDASDDRLLVGSMNTLPSAESGHRVYYVLERESDSWNELVRMSAMTSTSQYTPRNVAMGGDMIAFGEATYSPFSGLGIPVTLYTEVDCTGCSPRGDLNGDGSADANDIPWFIDCVTSDATACPCADLAPPIGISAADLYGFVAALLAN